MFLRILNLKALLLFELVPDDEIFVSQTLACDILRRLREICKFRFLFYFRLVQLFDV